MRASHSETNYEIELTSSFLRKLKLKENITIEFFGQMRTRRYRDLYYEDECIHISESYGAKVGASLAKPAEAAKILHTRSPQAKPLQSLRHSPILRTSVFSVVKIQVTLEHLTVSLQPFSRAFGRDYRFPYRCRMRALKYQRNNAFYRYVGSRR